VGDLPCPWKPAGSSPSRTSTATACRTSYYPSTGNGVGALVTTGITGISSSDSAIPLSVTGDGLPDLGVIGGGSMVYYQHAQVTSHPDLLSSLTDGDENTIQPSYISITAGAYNLETGAQDPESDWIGDLWVTETLTLPDGIGGTYNQAYDYSGARWNRLRGFEGFAEIKATDSRNHIYSDTSYNQLFPLAGMPSESDVFQSDGTPISKTMYVNSPNEIDSTQYEERYFPYPSKVTRDTYEVGGSENGDEITDEVTNYTPDSYGNFTEVDSTLTDTDPGSPFSGGTAAWTTNTTASFADDTTAWCLSLPTSIKVEKTAPGEPSITRTTTYTPDDTNCRESSEVEDAGNANYDVTRSFSYDSFGNVKQLTVTGAGMSPRIWNIGWGNTGQFPETIQDPVAAADGYEEAIGYNFGQGLKSSDVVQTTGGIENAPPVKWYYDSFGRLSQEVLSDGTSQNFSYAACGSSCYNSNHFETVSDTIKGSGGAEITDRSTYLDHFGRPLVLLARLMDGTYAQVERQYDNMGNVLKQSAPCSASGCNDYWTQVSYDLLNRPTNITQPDAGNTSLTKRVDYAGRTTKVSMSQMGEVNTEVTDVTGALRETRDSYAYGQNFTLDSDGNVLSVTDNSSNSITSYTYDYGGEGDYLASRNDRALGEWLYHPDALGEISTYTDAKGQVFDLRLTEREDGVPTSGSPETVTTWAWGHTPAQHDVGRLDQAQTTTAAGVYTESSSYDADGRLSDEAISIPGDTTYHYDYAYDPTTGLLSTLQYPVSGGSYRLTLAQCYQYGILTEVADTSCSGSAYWKANAENPLGEITSDTLGNGIVTQRQFYPQTGWLSQATSGTSSSPAGVQNQSYLYDLLGDVIQRADNNIPLTESFWYDYDNRLTKSTLQSGNTTTTNLQVWYNPDGGISQKVETGGTDAPVPYTVSQWTSYNYPQTITGTVPTVQGNVDESAAFDYGPGRQRWRMVYTEGSASETTEYIGGLMEKVTSSSGSLAYRYYIRGADGLAAIQSVDGSGNPTTHYALSDQEGSVSSILDSGGNVVVNESFTPFGVRREASAWSGLLSSTQGGMTEEGIMDGITRQGFTGQTALGLIGLNHMNGRVEDAVTGTFLSPDPRIPDPTSTQAYNRYLYVDDSPLSYTDPTGFDDTAVDQNTNSGGGGGAPVGGLPQSPGCPFGTICIQPPSGCGDAECDFIDPSGPDGWDRLWTSGNTHANQAPPTQGGYLPILWGPPRPGPGTRPSTQQSDPYPQLQPVTVSATRCCASVSPDFIDTSPFLFLAGATANAWNGPLTRMGCTGGCKTLLAVATVVAVPEAAEAEAGSALVPMTDAAYNYGTVQTIAGYEVAGTAGMVGSTYSMNIWGLYATEDAQGIGSLASAIQAQAAALGATDISITGNAIINPSILNMGGVAARYGFSFTQINSTTVLLQGAVP
jgi:RHS repeat-associated protein